MPEIKIQCKPCKEKNRTMMLRSEEQAIEHLWAEHFISTTPAYAWEWLLRTDL